MSIPTPPSLGYSFTSFSTANPTAQQPGAALDAEFNRIYNALSALILTLEVSVNADGTLSTAAVETAYSGGTGYSGTNTVADAPSAASAVLAQAWAEYLPGPIPAADLAGTGITGNHWSARWWANQAMLAASYVPNMLTTKNLQTGLVGLAYPHDGVGVLTNDGSGNLSWSVSVPAVGVTMLGPLVLQADPTVALGAATKEYVDAVTTALTAETTRATTAEALAVPKAGGTMTGALTLNGNPASALVAAPKQYVDAVTTALTTETTRATTAEAAVSTAAALFPWRNRLINGALEINQRAGSPYAAASSTYPYTSDRWFAGCGGAASTITLGANSAYGSRNVLTLATTVPAANIITIGQRIEAVNTYDLVGKQVTVSFYCAYTLSAGTMGFSVVLNFPTAVDNYAGATAIQSIAFTPTSTPGLYTATFNALPAGAANGLSLQIFGAQSGATGNLSLSVGTLSLEVGTVANAFERRPFPVELALCQRYYETSYDYGTAPGTATALGSAVAYLSSSSAVLTQMGVSVGYRVTKRADPTLTCYSGATGAANKLRDAVNNVDVSVNVSINAQSGHFVYGISSTPAATVDIQWQWTASAEL